VNFCQVEIFPIREDISSDRSRAPATRKRAAAAAGQEGGLPPPPLLLPPAPAPAPAPAPGIPYIIRESAASENRITSCSAVVSKRSVPLRHSVETLHSRFSHSSRIPRFYVISTSKSREIARPADSEKSASLKPPRHFLVFAPIYRGQLAPRWYRYLSWTNTRAPSLSLSLSLSRSRCTRAFTYPLDLPFSSLRSPRTPPLRHEPS